MIRDIFWNFSPHYINELLRINNNKYQKFLYSFYNNNKAEYINSIFEITNSHSQEYLTSLSTFLNIGDYYVSRIVTIFTSQESSNYR